MVPFEAFSAALYLPGELQLCAVSLLLSSAQAHPFDLSPLVSTHRSGRTHLLVHHGASRAHCRVLAAYGATSLLPKPAYVS